MNMRPTLLATGILIIDILFHHFHVVASDFEFQSSRNENQSALGNGTLLNGVDSIEVDNKSMGFSNGNPRFTDDSVTLQVFANETQNAAVLEPRSVLENANTENQKVKKSSAPGDDGQENTAFRGKTDLASAGEEQNNSPSIALKSSTDKTLATGGNGVAVKRLQVSKALKPTDHRPTTSTEDPPAQPDLLLLAKMKEIEEMENANAQRSGSRGHHVARIHVITALLWSGLVLLLWGY
ncbi:hypothetical protein BsWGS_16622 [Bradybaena similaris]